MSEEEYRRNQKLVFKVTTIGIFVNIVLTAMKLGVGIYFANLAVISDAATSGIDILTSLLIIMAIFMATPKRDRKHNYGREKIEYLVVLALSFAIFALGVVLLWQGIEGILNPHTPNVNAWLITVIVISLIVKEFMYFYGMHYYKITGSEMVRADAVQSRGDSLSSVAVLTGLITSLFMGTNIVESVAVVFVAFFIFKVAFDTFRPALHQLTDRSADEDTVRKIVSIVNRTPGVLDIEKLHTRLHGSYIYVDLMVEVDGDLSTHDSYAIGSKIHDDLEENEGLKIKAVNVIIKPDDVD